MFRTIRKLTKPSLFWKIFLWFWLATLLTLTSIIFLYSITSKDTRLVPTTVEESELLRQTAITVQLRHVIEEYQNGLPIQPSGTSKELDNTFIINNQGYEISDKEVPDVIYQLRAYYKQRNRPATVTINNYSYSGPEIVFSRGQYYLLFIKKKSQQHFSTLVTEFYHSISIWHLLTALGISFLVCFALAWYLTRPIHQLQKATKALAKGNLDARAKDYVGKRGDEFFDLAEDFDLMADRINRIIMSQKRLLSDVSHELRSPLTRMQIAASLAQKNSHPECATHIDRIELEVERLDQLIGELLQVAALERGNQYGDPDIFVVNDLLDVIISDAQFEATANNKEVLLQESPTISFKGFYNLLGRSIENVIRNAIRHTPDGTKIVVQLKDAGRYFNIVITDQGQGIDEDHLNKIFEPFYRPTEARERSSGGTGLGLTIAKRGVEVNGGSIKAENAESGGLQVTMTLPKTVI
ncbi:ATP-binding protein [Kangiella sediminilitoris]|uniref:histidine kinase n=1 Tax=Kangiella sediminilitoris TaxID=1144748 RepID=A0A1B3BDK2_9GAMM|nr:ATP-binding protein [Kangiella sediminilitoris]AOE50767.1 Histidine kinase [Kangiella sediminilitoris]